MPYRSKYAARARAALNADHSYDDVEAVRDRRVTKKASTAGMNYSNREKTMNHPSSGNREVSAKPDDKVYTQRFNKAARGDFSGMTDNEKAYMSSEVHKARAKKAGKTMGPKAPDDSGFAGPNREVTSNFLMKLKGKK